MTSDEYYLNPNYCLFCNKIIEIKDNQRISDVIIKKFCNKSCAASFNNKGISRNKKEEKLCKCGNKKSKGSINCKKCSDKIKSKIGDRTLSYFIKDKKYLSSKCQEIRTNAKKVIEKSNIEKVCCYCNNHEFDSILEVHHIKGILKFDQESLISEINDINNLVWLCPNHHTMLEKGLIIL